MTSFVFNPRVLLEFQVFVISCQAEHTCMLVVTPGPQVLLCHLSGFVAAVL